MKFDRVSILLLSWNGRHHLEHCLPALARQRAPGVDFEILVLDNGSTDGTTAYLEEHHPEVRRIRSDVNLGFCGGNNHLAREATGDALILLNDDTRPHEDWLAALVDAARRAPDDVGAVSGLILDWDGERLDFGRGLMAFDGHAFQHGYRRPLAGARADGLVPNDGDELFFACGGNMLIRRDLYRELGGFDGSFFAYLEDVDLGWRLWSAGYRVLAAPGAVVHHRSMATSQQLGNANRGFLFERNAFLTVTKNLDDVARRALMPAIWLTLVHRTQTLLVQNNLGGGQLTLDPYAGLIANTASPAAAEAAASTSTPSPASVDETELFAAGTGGPPETTLAEKWRGYGPREFVRRGLRKAARLALPGFLFDEPAADTSLTDPRTVAQLQAITWILGHQDAALASRDAVQKRRRRPDAEIFERFPPVVVPTYPGDRRLFGSRSFDEALNGAAVARYALEDLMDLS
ncbi:MAG: glycosyltransferase family 2 protein [Acidobacteriota bacterium]